MKKPLTNEGLQELLYSLYQLPDEALQKEAATLATDLRTWLDNNFDLVASQRDYILAVDNRQIANTASSVQRFMINRSPITLLKDEREANADSEGKFFGLKTENTSGFSPKAGYSEAERLTITISYT